MTRAFASDDREQGFIVLHRRVQSSPDWVSLRGDQRSVVISLLLLANWKPGHFWYGKTKINIGRGELAHSLKSIAEHAGVSVKVARTAIDLLISRGFLTVQNPDPAGTGSGTQGGTGPRILKISNYGKYQDRSESAGTPLGAVAEPERARDGHSTGTARAQIEQGKPCEQVSFPLAPLAVVRAEAVTEIPGADARAGDRRGGDRRGKKPPPDPRTQPALEAIERVFLEVKGYPFTVDYAKDGGTLKGWLRGKPGVTVEDIAARWRTMLHTKRTASLAAFLSSWNDLGGGLNGCGPQKVIGGVGDFSRKDASEF